MTGFVSVNKKSLVHILSNIHDTIKTFRENRLAPKKWLGQNLLVDRRYLDRIIDEACLVEGEYVVEIGAGLGALTLALTESGSRVIAIEIDSGFFRELQKKFETVENVELIHADALKFNFRELAERIGRLRVVANLPYNVSSRLVFMFQDNSDIFSSLIIMLQKEVAERFMANPGGKEYGTLSVLLGIRSSVQRLFDIPNKAFYPVPEVASTLIRIDFDRGPGIHVTDYGLLTRLVKAAFASRRKTLRNNLKSLSAQGLTPEGIRTAAEQASIDLGRRAETLSPVEFAALSNAISAQLSGR